MYRVWTSVSSFALLLLLGALGAMLAATFAPGAYAGFIHYPLWFNSLLGPHVADWTATLGPAALDYNPGDAIRVLTLRSLVNEMLMALFFAFVAKEMWEAIMLRGGELRGTRALVPLAGTLGGVLVPALLYLALASLWPGADPALKDGWAIPTATELAFAYVIGLWLFGPGHAAIRFLLLLAMTDDALGFLILLAVYPGDSPDLSWLALPLGAALTVYVLCNWLPRHLDRNDLLMRRTTFMRRRLSFWPYALAGVISWYGVMRAGLNPALGLLPILPCLPHADRPYGILSEAEAHLSDLLNTVQHGLHYPVAVTLLLFGLVNCGFTIGSAQPVTLLVALPMLLGKPLGIFLFCWLALKLPGLSLPQGLRLADLPVLGCAAGAGMTVSMTLANAAFPIRRWRKLPGWACC